MLINLRTFDIQAEGEQQSTPTFGINEDKFGGASFDDGEISV